MSRKYFLLLLIIPFFIALPDRFSPAWIVSGVSGDYSPFHCPEIAQIASQPLRYLGHGLQSIAFATPDGHYVVKFFLQKRFRPHFRLTLPFRRPAPPRIRCDLLTRYELAFRVMPEETGLIAVHLAASQGELPFCTIELNGQTCQIDLNSASFVIQRCGIPFCKLPAKQKKEAIPALRELLQARAMKGFTDSKNRINEQNFALFEGKAIMIDLGNVVFVEEQKKDPSRELERVERLLAK